MGARYSKVIRFAIIGVLAFFVDWLVMKFFIDRQTHFLVARLLSFLVAVSFTFVLNKYWTFRNAEPAPILVQFFQFFAANSVGGLVNYTVSTSSYFFLLNSNPRFIWLSLVFGSAAGFVFNFVMSSRYVFRNR
nr:GtrA family protein [Duganella levis]